jgi:hypothetical protein
MAREHPEDLLPDLELLPSLLGRVLAGLPAASLTRRPAAGGFATVEQAWHLADLEAEAFAVRIGRLLAEEAPALPDFDGAGTARARRYLELDAGEGAARFRRARAGNLGRLRALAGPAWRRAGTQAGVGPICLADLPRMMAAHDRSHAAELADLLAEIAPDHEALPDLRALAIAEAAGAP